MSVRVAPLLRCEVGPVHNFLDEPAGFFLMDVVRRLFSAAAVIVLVGALYLLVARPYQLTWGATDAEIRRSMPGDELSRQPTFLATRAITIDGTPDDIWPWLVQMGYGRAGFYGYDIVENIGSPRGLRSLDTLAPELQGLAVGDPLPLSAVASLVVHAVEPPRHLVWAGENGAYPGAFTWALYPVDATRTRLVSRIQWTHHWTGPLTVALDVFTEFTDVIAVRKILHGVKDRVEGREETMSRQVAECAVYLWALASMVVAIGRLLWHPPTRRMWLTGVGAGTAWLVVWYATLMVSVGALVNVLVLWAMYRGRVRRGGDPSSRPLRAGASA